MIDHFCASLLEKGFLSLEKLVLYYRDEVGLGDQEIGQLFRLIEESKINRQKGVEIDFSPEESIRANEDFWNRVAKFNKMGLIDVQVVQSPHSSKELVKYDFKPFFNKVFQFWLKENPDIETEWKRKKEMDRKREIEFVRRKSQLLDFENQLKQKEKALLDDKEILKEEYLRIKTLEESLLEKERWLFTETERIAKREEEVERIKINYLTKEKALLEKEEEIMGIERYLQLLLDETNINKAAMQTNITTNPSNSPFNLYQVIKHLEQKRGNLLNPKEREEIRNLHLQYGWTTEIVIQFLEECFAKDIRHYKDYLRIARRLNEQGDISAEGIKEFFKGYNHLFEKVHEVIKELGSFVRVNDTAIEDYLKWTQDWGLSHEIILLGSREACRSASNPNLKYLDRLLENWKKKNITTAAEYRELITHYNRQKERKSSKDSRKRSSCNLALNHTGQYVASTLEKDFNKYVDKP